MISALWRTAPPKACKATLVLGSREAAVQWLTSPAMGLNQQRPVDLLATPMGTQLVEELLDRIEYGVYA